MNERYNTLARGYRQHRDDRAPDSERIQLMPWCCNECGAQATVGHICKGGSTCWIGRDMFSNTHLEYYCHECGCEIPTTEFGHLP